MLTPAGVQKMLFDVLPGSLYSPLDHLAFSAAPGPEGLPQSCGPFPGIFASVVLALSKCVGETIAVMMICGSVASIPGRLSDGFYTLPALIGNNYGEMASIPLYESAIMFAALLLAVIVLLFNVLSRIILYRIQKNMA